MAQLTIAEKVSSISEMAVSLQQSNIQNGKGYNFIMVAGHAAEGVQGLGCNRGERGFIKGKQFIHDALDEVNDEMNTITNALDTNQAVKPVLFLGGCLAGSGENGDKLLKGMSQKMHDILIVASKNAITYKADYFGTQIASVGLVKLVKLTGKQSRVSTDPLEFKYAFNGKLIKESRLSALVGVDSNVIYQELILINNEF